MRAMILSAAHAPLREVVRPEPAPAEGEIAIRVSHCGVCRTDLHVADGELDRPHLPLVLGHEIVGRVAALGRGATRFRIGDRVGVPWLAWTCGVCPACVSGRENLCPRARFTGYDRDGGYAEVTTADERYCFALPSNVDDARAAPLLCAGLIGLRALRATGDARRVGLYGFGAAAHLVTQIALSEGREVFAFTRAGDVAAQSLARELGACWTGASTEAPPAPLDAAILFAPAGELVVAGLRAVERGGTVVCAGIHMSDIPSFPYELLWGERSIRSIANLTRADGDELFHIATRVPLDVRVTPYPLARANEALGDLRAGRVVGAAVLHVG